MTTFKRFGGSALIIGGFALAMSAQAASTTTTTTTVKTPITTTVETTATTNVLNNSVNANANVNANVNVNSNTSTSNNNSAFVGAGSVSTSADFTTYAAAVTESDANVSKVSSRNDNEVSLWYKQRAKFLGFIPMNVSVQAVTKADGSVAVKYPWYSFLTTHGDSTLKADLDAAAGSMARVEGGATFSANTQARILDAMKRVMKIHYDASVNAEASATTSAY